MLNLKTMYGHQYRIRWDEAREGRSQDPAMMQIPCQYGIIYPHSATLLVVEIDYHNPTANRVGRIPGVTLHQDGDQEKTFLFPVELFPEVARIVKPRVRRRLSPENRQRLAEAGAKYGFQPRIRAPEASRAKDTTLVSSVGI